MHLWKRKRGSLLLATALGVLAAAPVHAEQNSEFDALRVQLRASTHWNTARLERETFRPEALIRSGDRTPTDILLRRTTALLHHLASQPDAPDLRAEAAELDVLRGRRPGTEAEERAQFAEIAAIRRRIAFKNPLLDFDRIVFLKHDKQARGERHMVDQYFGFNLARTGGVFVLENPFGDHPVVKSLLAERRVEKGRLGGRGLENAGSFISLELDYDARTLLFSFTEAEHTLPPGVACDTNCWSESDMRRQPDRAYYHFRPETCFHVFRMDLVSGGLTQLTDGRWNDIDPCFLPNGRIAFISSRAGGQCRCGFRPDPTSTLYAMQPDGSDLVQLSFHDTNEWQPSVDANGMLVYTRWDYVDRDSDAAHHLWRCFPDGRDPRSPHGNYPDVREMRPWMEMSIRAIPGSRRYIAVAAPHHGEAYGSLVLIDPALPDDRAMSQVRRLTPEVPFPESESAPGVPHPKGRHSPNAEVYGTPWPLSEDFHLVVYDEGRRNYGIYLLDSFGNRELLYRDDRIACLDPIPLKPRPRPPVIPTKTTQAKADQPAGADLTSGTVLVLNAYESERPWPAGTKIKELRIIQLFPKDNSVADEPAVGHAAQSLCRGVLGTVPVEADGSAHFSIPAGASVYFQALDEQGLAVQTMRSATYVHPGETLTCVGCHEKPHAAPASADGNRPLALRRPPSRLQPEAEGSYPLTFARLVQPVLDRHCTDCHEKKRTKKAPSLRGDRFTTHGWSDAFTTLDKFAWGRSGGNGIALREQQYSVPGEVGARASKLYALLKKGHHDVELPPDAFRRITLWLDGNSNFYGAYHDTGPQARGQIVPPREGLPEWTRFEQLIR